MEEFLHQLPKILCGLIGMFGAGVAVLGETRKNGGITKTGYLSLTAITLGGFAFLWQVTEEGKVQQRESAQRNTKHQEVIKSAGDIMEETQSAVEELRRAQRLIQPDEIRCDFLMDWPQNRKNFYGLTAGGINVKIKFELPQGCPNPVLYLPVTLLPYADGQLGSIFDPHIYVQFSGLLGPNAFDRTDLDTETKERIKSLLREKDLLLEHSYRDVRHLLLNWWKENDLVTTEEILNAPIKITWAGDWNFEDRKPTDVSVELAVGNHFARISWYPGTDVQTSTHETEPPGFDWLVKSAPLDITDDAWYGEPVELNLGEA